ncbi:serine/threonine-protein phosphatase 2A 55 kDa regulatory subunit B delta isoform [Silurus meridionalis]|nr:serine/threonine-protein phosphatase 2A 55 kDa regulatory subunit B delta isoform [Silurus meridionalis]
MQGLFLLFARSVCVCVCVCVCVGVGVGVGVAFKAAIMATRCAPPWMYKMSPAADIISTVEFNFSGELLATGDKGGRVVIFQREQESKNRPLSRGEYNVYSTFQSHEPEFDYLKSLEIEEKINKIRWLPQQNAAHFLLSTNDIVDIKPANMEELTEVITAAECHPHQCNVFVYSSSKGTIRLCDMRAAALCDRHSKWVSTADHPLFQTNYLHVLPHHIHKPPPWPSSFPPTWWLHPQHSPTDIPHVPPLHITTVITLLHPACTLFFTLSRPLSITTANRKGLRADP